MVHSLQPLKYIGRYFVKSAMEIIYSYMIYSNFFFRTNDIIYNLLSQILCIIFSLQDQIR